MPKKKVAKKRSKAAARKASPKKKKKAKKPAALSLRATLYRRIGPDKFMVQLVKKYFTSVWKYQVIELIGGQTSAAMFHCHAKKNPPKGPADIVCWINLDTSKHVIDFMNGLWPFEGSAPVGGIALEPNSASEWFRLSQTAQKDLSYQYMIDGAIPPPNGPDILSDD